VTHPTLTYRAIRRALIVEGTVDAGNSLSMVLRLDDHELRVARTGLTAIASRKQAATTTP